MFPSKKTIKPHLSPIEMKRWHCTYTYKRRQRLIQDPEWVAREKSAWAKYKCRRKALSKTAKKVINQKAKDDLTDSYVALVLGFSVKDLSPEILEAKRTQLKLHRLCQNKHKHKN